MTQTQTLLHSTTRSNFFHCLDSRKSVKERTEWVSGLLAELQTLSQRPPTYVNGERTILLMKRHEEMQKPLNERSVTLRLSHLVQGWLFILRHHFPQYDLSLSPREFIRTHCWKKFLETDPTLDLDYKLRLLLTTMKSEGEGLFMCPRCKTKKFVKTQTQQKARCDEGMATINSCLCGMRWQEHS